MKKCNVCKEEKALTEFNSNRSNKDFLAKQCKMCKRKIDVEYRNKKREYNSLNPIDYSGTITCCICKEEKNKTEFNKNKNTITGLTYECKKCQTNRTGIYYKENKEDVLSKQKKYYLKTKDSKLEYQKKYNIENKEKVNAYQKQYQKENRVTINKGQREYNAKRKRIDPIYKFSLNTRSMISMSFKRFNDRKFIKSKKAAEILGCDMEFFIKHMSNLFKEGMTLENHGEWHIDHIVPLSTATTEDDVIKLNHYTNLQPLWASDNLSKGCKVNS